MAEGQWTCIENLMIHSSDSASTSRDGLQLLFTKNCKPSLSNNK
jgi:hypothetical protein